MIFYFYNIFFKMVLITVDGNIGSGKTSVLNYLHRNYKIPVDLEPVENWNNYLSDLYNESVNVFKFQIRVWLDRCWIQEKTQSINIFVERSPRFIQDVFIKIAEEEKMISENEKEILFDLHKKTNKSWENAIQIMLRSSSENCYKRIKKRNRESEVQITEEYLKKLHEKHEILCEQLKKENKQIIIIDVDNKSTSEVASEILQLTNEYLNQNI